MTMCSKTGGDVYLVEWNCYVHCDIYSHPDGDFVILRTSPAKLGSPCNGKVHGRIENVEFWFDQDKQWGTLIARGESNWTYYGYDGIPPEQMETY